MFFFGPAFLSILERFEEDFGRVSGGFWSLLAILGAPFFVFLWARNLKIQFEHHEQPRYPSKSVLGGPQLDFGSILEGLGRVWGKGLEGFGKVWKVKNRNFVEPFIDYGIR